MNPQKKIYQTFLFKIKIKGDDIDQPLDLGTKQLIAITDKTLWRLKIKLWKNKLR